MHLKLSKPTEVAESGSYVARVTSDASDKRAVLRFDGAYIAEADLSTSCVLVKDSSQLRCIQNINEQLAEIILNKQKRWFGTKMEASVIESYLENPITYDKNHGHVVKLRVSNMASFKDALSVRTQLSFTARIRDVRFLKRKFFMEMELSDLQHHDDAALQPEPHPDDIESMRTECVECARRILADAHDDLRDLETGSQTDVLRVYAKYFDDDD